MYGLLGDLLTPDQWGHIKSDMLHGFDFDSTMLRTSAMNLILHGVDNPNIHYQDTMSGNFIEKFPKQAQNYFDVILANPPFKGSLDFEDISKTLLSKVKTKKTQLLFIALILRMLKIGGRSATIVPDGVLFGSQNAEVNLRKLLIDENQLEAVISLPSGVFKPYAGVSTAIIVFTKGGSTKDVFFYDVQNDGYSLDDKREPQPDKDDLKDVMKCWRKRDLKIDTDRTKKHFFIPVDEIRENKYDLSINHYKEVVPKEEHYDPPKEILGKMKALEDEIQKGLGELEDMLQ
jgi:type I restriction enzyme M protein